MINHTQILSIQSDRRELQKVELFLQQLFKKESLPANAYNKVLLVVSEAVINSIEHGNKGDLNKKVTIKFTCNNSSIKINVSDEGDGFNYSQVKNPLAPENRKNEYGRGIYIMKAISNNLNFLNSGKSVEIKINLSE